MRKIISLIAVSVLACSCSAYAAFFGNAAVLKDTKVLSISEQYDGSQKLTVTVAPKDQVSINSANLPVFMYLYRTDANGKFELNIPLSDKWRSGRYCAYIDSGTDTRTTEFIYVNPNDINTLNIILSVNAMQSGKEIAKLLAQSDELGDNASKIGLDSSSYEYEKFSENAFAYCISERDVDYSLDTFLQAYNKGIVIESALDSARLADSSESLKTIIEDNHSLFSIDMSGNYSLVKSKEQVFDQIYKNKESLTDTLAVKKAFDDAVEFVIVNSVKTAENYGEIRAIIEEGYSLYGIDPEGDYESVKNKYKVFVKMFENKDSFTDIASIKEFFDYAVHAVLDSESTSIKKPVSSSSSGGGGGKLTLPSTTDTTVIDSPIATPETDMPNEYSDMNDHFAYSAVKSLSDKKIISGYLDGTFKPDNPVTRAEFAKIAALSFGIEPSQTIKFSDVSADDWFSGYVGALCAKDVIKGFDGKFNPNAPITRQDAACVIHRLLGTIVIRADTALFDDASDISAYAKDSVAALRSSGIVNGSENKFYPLSNVTRAEAAIMFSNAINAQN